MTGGDLTFLLAELAKIDAKLQAHIKTFSPTMSPGDLLLYNAKLLQLQTDRTNLLAQIASATTTATTTYTTVTANNGVNNRKTAANTAITTAEATNLATRKDTDKQTASEYAVAENNAWNIYYVKAVAADVAYLNAYEKIEKKFSSARSLASNKYMSTVVPAYMTYTQQQREYEAEFLIAVAKAGGNQGDYTQVVLRTTGDDGKQPKGREWGKDSGWWWLNPWSYPVARMVPSIIAGNTSLHFFNQELAIRDAQRPLWEKGRELGPGHWQYDIYKKEYHEDFLKGAPLDLVVDLAEVNILAVEVISGTATMKVTVTPKGSTGSVPKQITVNTKTGGSVANDGALLPRPTHPNAHGFTIRDINPTGNTLNCGDCAVQVDILLSGGKSSLTAKATSYLTDYRQLERLYGRKFTDVISLKTVVNDVKSGGSGTRGIIFAIPEIKNGKDVPGHFFNVVNQNGVITFLDGQIGTGFTEAELSMRFVKYRYMNTNP